MAKATRHGGASMTPEEIGGVDGYLSPRVRRQEVGPMKRARKREEEDSFPGSNSDPHTHMQSKSSEMLEQEAPSPAQETDNPSSGEQVSDTAHSADGNIQETERESPSPQKPARKAPVKATKRTASGRARVRSLDDDDEF